jgi:hypothetical protein
MPSSPRKDRIVAFEQAGFEKQFLLRRGQDKKGNDLRGCVVTLNLKLPNRNV